jgi:hypothetical protein
MDVPPSIRKSWSRILLRLQDCSQGRNRHTWEREICIRLITLLMLWNSGHRGRSFVTFAELALAALVHASTTLNTVVDSGRADFAELAQFEGPFVKASIPSITKTHATSTFVILLGDACWIDLLTYGRWLSRFLQRYHDVWTLQLYTGHICWLGHVSP